MRKAKKLVTLLVAALLIVQVVTILPAYADGNTESTTQGAETGQQQNNNEDGSTNEESEGGQSDGESEGTNGQDNNQSEGGSTQGDDEGDGNGGSDDQGGNGGDGGGEDEGGGTQGDSEGSNTGDETPTTTKCKHDCDNTVQDSSDLCKSCKDAGTILAPINLSEHALLCKGCNRPIVSASKHSFDANGRCTACDFFDHSSNSQSKSAESSSSSDATESLPPSTVVTANGKQVSSSISTVNKTNAVNGMAVTTPKQEVRNALGITDNTTSTSLYVCNSNKKNEKLIKNALESSGRKVYSSFNADMYSITKNGRIEKIHSSDKPVTLVFGIPAGLQNKKFSIIAFNNLTGEFVEFKDMDNDSKTITIDATVFGTFTLVIDED